MTLGTARFLGTAVVWGKDTHTLASTLSPQSALSYFAVTPEPLSSNHLRIPFQHAPLLFCLVSLSLSTLM